MHLIIAIALIVYIGLIVLWFVAEYRWSKRVRITLGVLAILLSLALPIPATIATVQIDDNSYYAASVRTLLDEAIEALDAGEEGFLDRLNSFRESQLLTYESRNNLLKNVREFREEGTRIRNLTEQHAPADAEQAF